MLNAMTYVHNLYKSLLMAESWLTWCCSGCEFAVAHKIFGKRMVVVSSWHIFAPASLSAAYQSCLASQLTETIGYTTQPR